MKMNLTEKIGDATEFVKSIARVLYCEFSESARVELDRECFQVEMEMELGVVEELGIEFYLAVGKPESPEDEKIDLDDYPEYKNKLESMVNSEDRGVVYTVKKLLDEDYEEPIPSNNILPYSLYARRKERLKQELEAKKRVKKSVMELHPYTNSATMVEIEYEELVDDEERQKAAREKLSELEINERIIETDELISRGYKFGIYKKIPGGGKNES